MVRILPFRRRTPEPEPPNVSNHHALARRRCKRKHPDDWVEYRDCLTAYRRWHEEMMARHEHEYASDIEGGEAEW
jgi:hypothetical protein